MTKTVFMFPGQGSQQLTMGMELYDTFPTYRQIIDNTPLDFDLKAILTGELMGIDLTQFAQPALFLTSMATAAVIGDQIKADACIGLSLGEYSAYCYAGAYSIVDGAIITRQRGLLMASALPAGSSTMVAVLMLSEELTQQACDEASAYGLCAIANYNAPGQLIVACEMSAKEPFMIAAKALGAKKLIELNVAGGFHSQLLSPSSNQLSSILQSIDWQSTNIPVYTNYSGLPTNDYQTSLTNQLSSPVRFESGITNLLAAGFDCFIEIGAGNVLSGLVKKIAQANNKEVSIMQVSNVTNLQQTIEQWRTLNG
jgi:[acyl-carrier-protein] S-malonyltransferase